MYLALKVLVNGVFTDGIQPMVSSMNLVVLVSSWFMIRILITYSLYGQPAYQLCFTCKYILHVCLYTCQVVSSSLIQYLVYISCMYVSVYMLGSIQQFNIQQPVYMLGSIQQFNIVLSSLISSSIIFSSGKQRVAILKLV